MKKVYKKPVLQSFGKMTKVTQGHLSGVNDPGGSNNGGKPHGGTPGSVSG